MATPDADWPLTVHLADETATAALAAALVPLLAPGDVVALSGQLGAGKTSLARGIIRAIAGDEIEVPSPTFTLVQDYRGLAPPVIHYDLYRLRDPAEVDEIGFGEADDDAVVLVEWPERAGNRLPAAALSVTLAVEGAGRSATIAGDAAWRNRLQSLGYGEER